MQNVLVGLAASYPWTLSGHIQLSELNLARKKKRLFISYPHLRNRFTSILRQHFTTLNLFNKAIASSYFYQKCLILKNNAESFQINIVNAFSYNIIRPSFITIYQNFFANEKVKMVIKSNWILN